MACPPTGAAAAAGLGFDEWLGTFHPTGVVVSTEAAGAWEGAATGLWGSGMSLQEDAPLQRDQHRQELEEVILGGDRRPLGAARNSQWPPPTLSLAPLWSWSSAVGKR